MTVETMKRNLSKVMPFPFSVHLLLLHNAIICNDMYQDSEGIHYEILLGVHGPWLTYIAIVLLVSLRRFFMFAEGKWPQAPPLH